MDTAVVFGHTITNSSPLNDGPGTVYSDDEDMLFEGPTESSFVYSITEGTPSPRSQKGKEGLLPSKYKPRDSGIVLSDDKSMPARNSTLSTSLSSIYSDNDHGDDLVTPGIVPGALSGWPRISGDDDVHLHSFNQSHPYQYFHHDEDEDDAFILRTLEAGGNPSAAEGKKPLERLLRSSRATWGSMVGRGARGMGIGRSHGRVYLPRFLFRLGKSQFEEAVQGSQTWPSCWKVAYTQQQQWGVLKWGKRRVVPSNSVPGGLG
ncbi:hypothetical protein F4604DRAFT_1917052 [Suillus subluteus]|nr:hypothetical protein F4604DRAFT_1917052 [Suillus subluteus]